MEAVITQINISTNELAVGNISKAEAAAFEALRLSSQYPDYPEHTWCRTRAMILLAECYSRSGQLDLSNGLVEQSIQLLDAQEPDNILPDASTRTRLAAVLFRNGNHHRAMEINKSSLLLLKNYVEVTCRRIHENVRQILNELQDSATPAELSKLSRWNEYLSTRLTTLLKDVDRIAEVDGMPIKDSKQVSVLLHQTSQALGNMAYFLDELYNLNDSLSAKPNDLKVFELIPKDR